MSQKRTGNSNKSKITPLNFRNKADFDLPLEEMTMNLSSDEELGRFQNKQHQLNKMYQGKVLAFPYWKRHKHKARKILTLYKYLPWCNRLPLGISKILAEVFMR